MNIHYNIINEKAVDVFKSYVSKSYQLTKHKYFEIEIYSYDWYLFEFTFGVAFSGKDHAGIDFDLGILGKYISLKMYDHRHWDLTTNEWVK